MVVIMLIKNVIVFILEGKQAAWRDSKFSEKQQY